MAGSTLYMIWFNQKSFYEFSKEKWVYKVFDSPPSIDLKMIILESTYQIMKFTCFLAGSYEPIKNYVPNKNPNFFTFNLMIL